VWVMASSEDGCVLFFLFLLFSDFFYFYFLKCLSGWAPGSWGNDSRMIRRLTVDKKKPKKKLFFFFSPCSQYDQRDGQRVRDLFLL
jgi:hypothetical protein